MLRSGLTKYLSLTAMNNLEEEKYRVISEKYTVDLFRNPKKYGIDATPKELLENIENHKFNIFKIVKEFTELEMKGSFIE